MQKLLALDAGDLSRMGRFAVWAARLLFFLAREVQGKRVPVRAAALSYTFLGATVPLLTIGFAVASALDPSGFARTVRKLVFTFLMPEMSETAFTYADMFAENARTLGLLGGLLLVVTCVSAFLSVEAAFNDVWEVRAQRSPLFKMLAFWAFLTLGPVLVGVSFSFGASVTASPAWAIAAPIVKFVIVWGAFTGINIVIPFTNVRLQPALVGGCVTAALWLAAKWGFSYYVAHSFSASKIYGSFFLVPMTLLWLYVSWLIVLVGAQFTYTAQNLKLLHLKSLGGLRTRGRAYHGLFAVVRAGEAFRSGERLSSSALAREMRLPEQGVREMVNDLVGKKLLAYGQDGERLLPGRSIENLPVAEVLRQELEGVLEPASDGSAVGHRLVPLFRRVQRAGADALAGLTVGDLARHGPRSPRTAGARSRGAFSAAPARRGTRRRGRVSAAGSKDPHTWHRRRPRGRRRRREKRKRRTDG